MINIKLTIAYDGSRYLGWQRLGGDQRRRSIQGYLEEILEQIFKTKIRIQGSGRTDAGVHAKGQVANFKVPAALFHFEGKPILTAEQVIGIRKKCNALLPEDICVWKVEQVPLTFHSRYSAMEKTYEYRLDLRAIPCVFTRKYALFVEKELELEKMKRGAALLLGTHDFAAFSTRGQERSDTCRTIKSIDFLQDKELLIISVCGDGFLYNMVRIIVGTLLEIGKGEREIASIEKALETGDRQLAGATLSSVGLCLKEVKYEEVTL